MSIVARSIRQNLILVPILVPTLFIAVVLLVLYVLVPYSGGYNEVRESVIGFAAGISFKLEDWQHCLLVPLAAAVMVWLDRRRLLAIPVRGAWAGLPVILAGLGLYWFGYLADIVYFGYASAQLVLAGLVIFFLGWGWMRALAFPWLFLTFMWPMLFLDNLLAFPLRVIMSRASVMALNGIGVAATLSGTAILSAPAPIIGRPIGAIFSVDVANPCSGIRSLFALMMVSALYGHFALKNWWKQWILFFCAIPLAVVGNLFRILMLTFGTIALGSEVAIGSIESPSLFHMLSGYLVFAVAIGGMLVLAKLLNADWKKVLLALPGLRSASGLPTASTVRQNLPHEDAY